MRATFVLSMWLVASAVCRRVLVDNQRASSTNVGHSAIYSSAAYNMLEGRVPSLGFQYTDGTIQASPRRQRTSLKGMLATAALLVSPLSSLKAGAKPLGIQGSGLDPDAGNLFLDNGAFKPFNEIADLVHAVGTDAETHQLGEVADVASGEQGSPISTALRIRGGSLPSSRPSGNLVETLRDMLKRERLKRGQKQKASELGAAGAAGRRASKLENSAQRTAEHKGGSEEELRQDADDLGARISELETMIDPKMRLFTGVWSEEELRRDAEAAGVPDRELEAARQISDPEMRRVAIGNLIRGEKNAQRRAERRALKEAARAQ